MASAFTPAMEAAMTGKMSPQEEMAAWGIKPRPNGLDEIDPRTDAPRTDSPESR